MQHLGSSHNCCFQHDQRHLENHGVALLLLLQEAFAVLYEALHITQQHKFTYRQHQIQCKTCAAALLSVVLAVECITGTIVRQTLMFFCMQEALLALNEAVRIAQQHNDNAALAHALAALCQILASSSPAATVQLTEPGTAQNSPSAHLSQLLKILKRCAVHTEFFVITISSE